MKAWRGQKSTGKYSNHRAQQAINKMGSVRAVPSPLIYALINRAFKPEKEESIKGMHDE